MSQAISSLMQREVYSVGPDDTMQAVEALMVARALSWVPVACSASDHPAIVMMRAGHSGDAMRGG